MIRATRNHPGWGKGAIVKVGGRDLAEVLEDGEYRSDGQTFGLWHYQIKFENGTIDIHIPRVDDVLVKPVERWR